MGAYSLISCHFLFSGLKNIVGLYRVHADHLQVIRRLDVGFCRVPVDFCSVVLDDISAKKRPFEGLTNKELSLHKEDYKHILHSIFLSIL